MASNLLFSLGGALLEGGLISKYGRYTCILLKNMHTVPIRPIMPLNYLHYSICTCINEFLYRITMTVERLSTLQ